MAAAGETFYRTIPSPLGELLIAGDGDRLGHLYMPNHAGLGTKASAWRHDHGAFRNVVEQLDAYFGRELKSFDIRLADGGTAFQRRVWDALMAIPYGATVCYGEIARQLGDPRASRAVGLANGRNPISIIVPCHRVIGAGGALTGYGGGLDNKLWLLRHEGALPA